MKRLQLCTKLMATIIGIGVAGAAQAGDKGLTRQYGGPLMTTQGANIRTSGSPTGLQTSGAPNNLKKQGMTQQNLLNTPQNMKGSKIDPSQLTKKGSGPQGINQQIAKKGSMDLKSKQLHLDKIKDRCYFGKEKKFWSESCWNDKFGCETYFCPTRHCWYFWYEAFTCYLPCEYWATYCEPVVEIAPPVTEVVQPVVEAPPPPVEVAQPVVVQPVRYIIRPYVVRPYVVYPSFHCGPTFPYFVRH